MDRAEHPTFWPQGEEHELTRHVEGLLRVGTGCPPALPAAGGWEQPRSSPRCQPPACWGSGWDAVGWGSGWDAVGRAGWLARLPWQRLRSAGSAATQRLDLPMAKSCRGAGIKGDIFG